MTYLLIIIYMALFSRLSGSGFGSRWGIAWLPEWLFVIPIAASFAYAIYTFVGFWLSLCAFIVAGVWSYAFMQSGTWMFLSWTKHEPNRTRKSTLKPIIDWIAKRFGYELGSEGYSWIAAGLKGFLIGLPVGGFPLAILWPLGYEIGSHFKYPQGDVIKEVAAGAGAGIAVVLFLIALGA